MNADLAFRSRREAMATPARMRDQDTVDQAIGMLAGSLGITTQAAGHRIRDAAVRAGISEAQAARTVVRVLSRHPG